MESQYTLFSGMMYKIFNHRHSTVIAQAEQMLNNQYQFLSTKYPSCLNWTSVHWIEQFICDLGLYFKGNSGRECAYVPVLYFSFLFWK